MSKQFATSNSWIILRDLLEREGVARQHLNSYNEFVSRGLQNIVDEIGEVEVETVSTPYKIKFGRLTLGSPRVVEIDGSVSSILPMESRLRNLTYSAPILLEMTIEEEGLPRDTTRQHIGDLPVMVKSELCQLSNRSREQLVESGEDPNDPGGYFIIHGAERVIVGLEDLSPNKILVDSEKLAGSTTYKARVYSSVVGYRSKMELTLKQDGAINVKVPSCPVDLPFVIVMRALGIKSDKDIADAVSPKAEIQDLLEVSFDKASEAPTDKDSLVYIGNRVAHGMLEEFRVKRAQSMLDWGLLPHLGKTDDRRFDKAMFMGEAVCKLLELRLGWIDQDDKDHYGNKVIKFAGQMLADLFRTAFRNLVRDMKYQLERTGQKRGGNVVGAAIRTGIITDKLNNAIATGNWGRGKVGVTQLLDRTNYLSTLSHLRRVQSPLSRSQPNFEARDLHATHFGRICPSETPEGVNCVVPSTNVLLADGTQSTIAEIGESWQGTRLATVDILQNDMAQTTIARYFKTDPSRDGTPVYRVVTEAGRVLIATRDHPLLAGDLTWKLAGEVEQGDRVVVYPALDPTGERSARSAVILTSMSFPTARRKWEKTFVPSELRSLYLLPLKGNNPKLPILARIVGAVFSDAHLHLKGSPFVQFSLGTEDDGREVQRDLEELGFRSNIGFRTKRIARPEREYEMKVYTVTCYSKSLCTLLEKLGAPSGKKTDRRYSIPGWIMDGSLQLKLEFLSAYLGGDGPKPSITHEKGRKYSIHMPPINFHKVERLRSSGLGLARQLRELLEEFGCETLRVVSKRDYVRADGEPVTRVSIILGSSKATLEAVTQRIGYRYSRTKQRQALLVGEYLRISRRLIGQRIEKKESAAKLYRQGQFPSQIASTLGETRKTIEHWLYGDKYDQMYKPKSLLLPFNEWKARNVVAIGNDDYVLEEVIKKEPVAGIRDVRDVTTAADSHTFIANGFVTHNCGLVKNLALSAIISVSVPSQEVEEKLWELGAKQIRESDQKLQVDGCRIFMDGRFLGYVDDGERLSRAFRKLRREGQINPSASVLYVSPVNDKAYPRLYISLSSGRVLRPLILIESGRPLLSPELIEKVGSGQLSWRDLVEQGILELIDANEEENCLVAMGPDDVTTKNTHMELFPAAMFGIAASIIPYPEHNQSPRNTYESAMAKQSLGFSSPTYPISPHVRQHLLVSPQAPVVRTRTLDLLKIDERPIGTNCVVAVLSFEGYNIEDAIIMNRSSVERGLARSFFYRLYDGEAKQYLGGMRDTFEVPSAESNIRGYRGEKFYRLLEGDGVVAHESQVTGGDVVIGRTSPPRFMEEYKEFEIKGPYRRDTSTAVRPSESGVVDSVFMTENVEGGKMFKVRVRDMRVPEIGDKFASRHGQKGVIGLVVPQEDMPYSAEGIVPDVIINPHAFPSRMTVGQFIESIAGKAGAFRGTPVDGSAFAGESIEELEKVLRSRGFEPTGREVMYDGKTGKKFAADVFLGVVYYQKLHHMVADKIHARARGQVQMLTKQPTEGRARGGGLRFGEMERDCLIAYGASMVLKDRLLDEADKTEIYVCEKCGLIAYYDAKQRKYTCRVDGDQAKISTVVVAYAFKLLLQEMMSLNIAPRLQLKDKV
jgi:DNA-directed RNA polymerase subunit B